MTPLHFLKTALKDYRVGAFTATSRFAAERIGKHVAQEWRYCIEYGAGDGAVTKLLLEKFPSNGVVVAIELNDDLLKELRRIGDPRLKPLKGDVVELSRTGFKDLGLPEIHMAVSGIPFSFLRPRVREEVVRNTHRALHDGGKFVVYQYSLLMLPLLKKYFKEVSVSLEPRNFPPYFIMAARK